MLMKTLNFIVYQVLSNETIFLGLVALIGLLLQKKRFPQIIDGTVKTIIGLTVLTAGAGVLINATCQRCFTYQRCSFRCCC